MKHLSFGILAIALAGCSSINVTSDYDKNIDFSQYKTFEYFGWAEESNKILNRFDQERIEKAFGEEFKKRNLKIVEKGSGGDLVVTLYIVTEQKTSTTANTTTTGMGGYGYGGYYGYGPAYGWGPSMSSSTTTYSEREYTVGTLIVDVYDAKEKKLIWESIGKGTVDDNPDTRDKSIPKAVAKIMATYPIEPANE